MHAAAAVGSRRAEFPAVLELWLERAARDRGLARSMAAKCDPFRDPVGFTERESLVDLLDQVLGDMEPDAIQAALDNLVRIRAVQNLTASQALEFVFELKPILRARLKNEDFERLDANIDRLALCAFDQYVSCRERIVELRFAEIRRGLIAPGANRRSNLAETPAGKTDAVA